MEKGHIFENERSDANAFIQKYKKLSSKIIKTPKTCMFPNCNKESIKRSHTIQNASSLERMAKKGHVFQPVWEDFSSNYQMDKIGVNNASVFTGFCKEHEEIFRNYETKKKMSEKYDFILQIYRTICREVVNVKNWLIINEKTSIAYQDKKKEKFINVLEGEMGNKLDSIGIKKLDIEYPDNGSFILNRKIEEGQKRLLKFKEFYKASCSDVINKKAKKLSYRIFNLDYYLPISLAGVASFSIEKNEVIFIINILPFEKETFFLISSLKRDEAYLEEYFETFTQHPLLILDMVESWMIHGSDHWFINIDVWNKISSDKQKKILNDLLVTEKSIWNQYDLSIFDEVREEYLKMLFPFDFDEYSESLKALINSQKEKLEKKPGKLLDSEEYLADYWLKS
ncbi:conserved hypothetical protein [Bacillus cereus Q1]|uniref:Uncharacterized protein n=2 Tax=Bacillus TaxID=1386 RepID=B9IU67_BACCQ|nr:conserved hypothetical protein [Bacillus cereus Q1]